MFNCEKGGFKSKVQFITVMNMLVFQTPSILLILNTVFVKKSKDLLQGISKLDYLLKVSYFQRYKDTAAEKRKWTLFTGGNDSDEDGQRYSEESLKYGALMK